MRQVAMSQRTKNENRELRRTEREQKCLHFSQIARTLGVVIVRILELK